MKLQEQFEQYIQKLIMDERAAATVQKYTHDICEFLQWLQSECGENLSKLLVIQWRMMMEGKKNPATVNAAVAAVNGFLRYINRADCCVRPLKVQRMLYRERRQELTREEYFRLLQTAAQISEETACMLETICSTGIRVGELRYITVQAVQQGVAIIRNKGKYRTILLPEKLQKQLRRYCQLRGLIQGAVFINKRGVPISRYTIWRRLKRLCVTAQVAPEKVFPHNLRHLFAVCFYHAQHDLEHLADILGHSNINTTRIYTKLSGEEHRHQMDALRLTR